MKIIGKTDSFFYCVDCERQIADAECEEHLMNGHQIKRITTTIYTRE